MSFARRFRGLFSTAIIWGFAWALAGTALAFIVWTNTGRWPPAQLGFWRVFAFQLALWAGWGAFNGAVFGLILMAAERRRGVLELSPPRTALWGALGGMALPLLTYALFLLPKGVPVRGLLSAGVATLVSGALGAAIAAANLRAAQRLPSGTSDHGRLSASAT